MNLQHLNVFAQCKHRMRNYLAFITRFCYFLFEITTTSFLKMRHLGKKFGQAGGALAAGTLALGLNFAPMAANAGEASTTPVASNPEGLICTQTVGYPHANCGTPGYETSMTLEEILADKELTRDRMVLHFGPGPRGVGIIASALNDRGIPTTAIPGGPKGGFIMIVDGFPIKKHVFDEESIAMGTFGVAAQKVYARIMEIKANRTRTVASASATASPP